MRSPLAASVAARFLAQGWPKDSKAAVEDMTQKYGGPDEVTDYRMVWHWRLPWKRIVVTRKGHPHMWPSPHMDVLAQTVPYKVPLDKYDDLAAYDGSVFVERTAGELSARCGSETMNFVALNLAYDVITGSRSVEMARAEYGRLATQVGNDEKPLYATKLVFVPQYEHQGDPDQTVQ